MKRVRHALAFFAALGAALPMIGQAATTVLKEMPKEGEIPYGKVVYVDDGKCPRGQVKEVTGGHREKSIPRTVRCVERPAGAPSK